LSLTQATEAGTVYTPDELRALTDSHLRVHMDGARFANALAFLGCSAAEITWRAGVDILVLGGTKNGALPAELVVVFDRTLASEFEPRWHRAGHRVSKMRFLSAQLEVYLTDDLWLRNAGRANAAASRLAAGFANVPGIELVQPVQANVVFVRLAPDVALRLRADGFLFYDWPIFGEDVVRLVTAFTTSDGEVDALVAAAARTAVSS
jgi:threonine aldolase